MRFRLPRAIVPVVHYFAPAILLAAAWMASPSAHATPAFARQMNMSCLSCHAQQVPMLNSFGRHFKLSSFSMTPGDQPPISGMELLRTFNAGLGIRGAHLSTDNPAGRDTMAFPSGLSLMLGGRVVEDAGANLLFTSDGAVHLQGSLSKPLGDGRAGVALFGTNTHGPFIGSESYNTGLHKEIAMFDNSTRANAAQATGIGSGPATGLTAFYGGHGLTASTSIWGLNYNAVLQDGGKFPTDKGGLNTAYRLAYDVPGLGAWGLMVGAYGIDGTTTGKTADLYEKNLPNFTTQPWFVATRNYDHKVKGNGFDLQLTGSVLDMNVIAAVNHVARYKYVVGDTITNIQRITRDQGATSFEFQISPWTPVGLRTSWLTVDDKTLADNDYKVASFGVNYNYADNVRFSIEHSSINNKRTADFSEVLLTAFFAF